jgi:hypothetical protein
MHVVSFIVTNLIEDIESCVPAHQIVIADCKISPELLYRVAKTYKI